MMLETYAVVLTDAVRSLVRNMRSSPLLYVWFGFMLVFSIAMTAMLTMFLLKNKVEMSLGDVVFSVFFVFFLKSTVDFHKYYVQSSAVSFALATSVSQKRTIGEIILMIFWTNLGLWVFFSSLFSIFLSSAGVPLGYPVEYLMFTGGVMLGCLLGPVVSLHFFSAHRFRLIPAAAIIAGFWFFHDLWSLLFLLLACLCYLVWSLRYVLESFQYVSRKNREKERGQVRVRTPLRAIFFKESTVLWRDRLLFSFVFTAVATGGFVGYLAVFGSELFIPEQLRVQAEQFLPSVYVILGIYIVTIYTAVFPAINMFLAEEHTMWIIRHLPVKEKTMVMGKVCALALPFLCSTPVLAYYMAFAGTKFFVFSVWFLVFSFLAGVIIALPLGAKYVGRKSDVLLLYCVALLVLGVTGAVAGVETVVGTFFSVYLPLFYCGVLLIEFCVLLLVIEVSSRILVMKQRS